MRKILCLTLCLLGAWRVVSQDLFDLNVIPEIRILFKEPDWNRKLDSMKMAGSDGRLLATVVIDGKSFEQVGVRFKGNSSFKNPRQKGQKKLPFNLKANFKLKDQRFPGGYETLKLSNVFQDPSFLREVISYEIARKYMPAPRCNFVKIWVNGDYLGLYNNAEPVDETFLKKQFGSSDGTFIKCDPEWEDVKDANTKCPEGDKASLMYVGEDSTCYSGWYEMQGKGKNRWNDLISLCKSLSKTPDKIGETVNVDAVLWMHAFNNILVNLDSYTGRLSHNYYLYRTPDSLFTPIVWDMNISLGGFRFDGEKPGVLTDEELQNFSLFVHYKNKNPKRPLITNVLANALYRKIYVGHCRTILLENFANGEYLRLANRIRSKIDAEVKNDPHKLYSYEQYQQNLGSAVDVGASSIIGIEQLMKKRTELLTAHPLFTGKNPEVGAVKTLVSSNQAILSVPVKDAVKTWIAYRTTETEPYQVTEMFDDGLHGDGAQLDGVWGISLEKKGPIHYYIIAEGDRLAVCLPPTAAFKPMVIP